LPTPAGSQDLSAGRRIRAAKALLGGQRARHVLAGRAGDACRFREAIAQVGAEPGAAPNPTSKPPTANGRRRCLDKDRIERPETSAGWQADTTVAPPATAPASTSSHASSG